MEVRRSWRLNERHYGALQGRNKAQAAVEDGADLVDEWRRSWDASPPPMTTQRCPRKTGPSQAAQLETPRPLSFSSPGAFSQRVSAPRYFVGGITRK